MKFKWNKATSSLISKRIITLEGNLGGDPSLHWDSSDVLLSRALGQLQSVFSALVLMDETGARG